MVNDKHRPQLTSGASRSRSSASSASTSRAPRRSSATPRPGDNVKATRMALVVGSRGSRASTSGATTVDIKPTTTQLAATENRVGHVVDWRERIGTTSRQASVGGRMARTSASPALSTMSDSTRFQSPAVRRPVVPMARSSVPVTPTFPPALEMHLDMAASQIHHLVGDRRGGMGAVLLVIFDQTAAIQAVLTAGPRPTLETHGVECLSPSSTNANVVRILQAMYLMVAATLKTLPRSQAGKDATALAAWWGPHRAHLASVGGSAITDVPISEAARVFEIASFEWLRPASLSTVASLISAQYGMQVRGNDVRDLVEAVVGTSRVLVAQCWKKGKK
ncbi:hypothetical protein CspHIS471_0307780 [Cutaneotrichosporon sp. HIS471]|nr:hypothetical protein CspHIS471_0307780 [Cutaneotrichosporon sp. HIS471]